mmetsp:Transcript_13539/g.31402  ORF Transcript_13539/g.31402 Transcript_13539/m.31402 type:complete len:118 (+) Transcript_13539:47-400(+)
MALRSSLFRQSVRFLSTKEELWRTLHPIPDVHKEPSKLWQQLHPIPEHPTLDAKQEVFKPDCDWKIYHPLVETIRVPSSKDQSHASHSGWSASHATGGSELWRTLHDHHGITFRPRK